MSNSQMVLATKYKLLIPESKKDGRYRNTGAEHEREKLTTKIVPRAYVEERNAAPNHEFWIIDEQKTAELDKVRAVNIERQAKEKASAAATMGDLITALGSKLAPAAEQPLQTQSNPELEAALKRIAELEAEKEAKAQETVSADKFPASDEHVEGEPNESWSVAELRQFCDDNGIKYHPAAKESGLMKIINEAKA